MSACHSGRGGSAARGRMACAFAVVPPAPANGGVMARMTKAGDRTVFLNGAYVPETEAKVSIFDRGYLMADAVYEYTAVIGGKLIDFPGHMARLQTSLEALDFGYRVDPEEFLGIHRALISRNSIDVGGVYLQISRGVADRSFPFPNALTPTISAFTQTINFLDHPANETGLKVISVDDGRWARSDIKSVQLLYTCMARTRAVNAGAQDAFFVRDGLVTEATAANAFIVRDGRLITRALSPDILHGVTRRAVLDLAATQDVALEERGFSVEEVKMADEAFVTASPMYVLPVVQIDGEQIGSGGPGPITRTLRTLFLEHAMANAM